MASARTVAVVVPSPATSEVLLAASFTSWAPTFSNLLESSISSATLTPSLVTVGAPQPLSRTAFRPRGPRVDLTAEASLETPSRRDLRADSSNEICFAAMEGAPYSHLLLRGWSGRTPECFDDDAGRGWRAKCK